MWQNPYANNYNPLLGMQPPGMPPTPTPPGQTNIGQFSSPGVISPPPNANPFQTQPGIQTVTPTIVSPNQSELLQPQVTQQMGQMVVTAYENFKKSVVDSKEDGDDMILTVKIPTSMLKQDPNFGFLFSKQ
jgi:hypothetical protein